MFTWTAWLYGAFGVGAVFVAMIFLVGIVIIGINSLIVWTEDKYGLKDSKCNRTDKMMAQD